MPYQIENLCVFDVFGDKARLDGTSYVEFHPCDLPEEYACWLDGSVFIRDAGFDFFTECFYRAIPAFDSFSITKVTGPQLSALGDELRSFLGLCRKGGDRSVLFSRYASLFSSDIWDQVPTEPLRQSLVNAGGLIEDLRARSESDSGILWVRGM